MLNQSYISDFQLEAREAIKKIMANRGITNRELAKNAGVAEQSLSKMLNGSRTLTDATLAKIGKVIRVPFDSLKYGENLERFVSTTIPYKSSSGFTEMTTPYWSQQGEGVPFYDVDVFAGDVETFNDGPQEPVGHLHIPGAEDCDFSCRISGSSMATRIMPGAIIACKQIQDKTLISYGAVHLVITNEQRWVKVVRKHQDKKHVRLISHNPDYDEIECPVDKINRLYLVKIIVNQEEM